MSCTHPNPKTSGSEAICSWQWCPDCGAHRTVTEHYAEEWTYPRERSDRSVSITIPPLDRRVVIGFATDATETVELWLDRLHRHRLCGPMSTRRWNER